MPSTLVATNRARITPLGIPFDKGVGQPNKGVRQPSIVRCVVPGPDEVGKHPAHPSNRLVAQLNESWRVIDDPLQWRLQRKKGNSREKNSGWVDRSFCTTREGLLRRVREYCNEANGLLGLWFGERWELGSVFGLSFPES
jgi:hypothetical protein